jgi:hypothetical protein
MIRIVQKPLSRICFSSDKDCKKGIKDEFLMFFLKINYQNYN